VAEKGSSTRACSTLAELLLADSKPSEQKKAFENYFKCAELGDLVGLYWTGVLYFEGKGVEKDVEKSISYLTRAADLGNSHAD